MIGNDFLMIANDALLFGVSVLMGVAGHPPSPLALREGGRFLAALGMT